MYFATTYLIDNVCAAITNTSILCIASFPSSFLYALSITKIPNNSNTIANILVDKYQGKVPNKRKDLESLPMVGRKTANVVLSEYFKVPNIAVDTHVNRVSKRLALAKESDDVLEVEAKLKRKFKREDWNKRHHQLVLFGRYYCKAIAPLCDNCKLKSICKWQKEKAHD